MQGGVIIDWVLPLALAAIMFGIGLALRVQDFRRLWQAPAPVLLGLAGQLLLMPATAIAIAMLLPVPSEIAIGLVLLAACPGGTMSNVMSQLLKVNLALSVSLTALSTLLCVLTTPWLVQLALSRFGEDTVQPFSVWQVGGNIALIALLPVCLGMAVAYGLPGFAQRSQPLFARFSLLFLVVLVLTMIWREFATLRQSSVLLVGSVGLLSLNTCLLGGFLGRLCGQPLQTCKTLCIEVGIQNAPLAMVIAISVLDMPAVSLVAGLYGLIMYLAPYLICQWLGHGQPAATVTAQANSGA